MKVPARSKLVPIGEKHTMELPITGGCYCGAIRYRIDDGPHDSLVCYCSNCRRAVGSHSVSWMYVRRDRFRLTQGNPTEFRSDTGAWRSFFATCGASLIYHADGRDVLAVTLGSLDEPKRFPPNVHDPGFPEERLDWEPLMTDVD